MAQWIAHLTSNQGVAGSSPAAGISFFLTAIKNFNWIKIYRKKWRAETAVCPSRSKGADLRPAIFVCVGSNPTAANLGSTELFALVAQSVSASAF